MMTDYGKERIKPMRNYTPKAAEAFDQATRANQQGRNTAR